MNERQLGDELQRLKRWTEEELTRLRAKMSSFERGNAGLNVFPNQNRLWQNTLVDGDLTVTGAINASIPLADHDHSGDAGDGGTFDAANLTSGAAADAFILTADGAGGAAWEAPPAGVTDHTLLSNIGSNTHDQIDAALLALETVSFTDYSAGSTITGWTSYTAKELYYKVVGRLVFCTFYISGVSNATGVSFTLPYKPASNIQTLIRGRDNTVNLTTPCLLAMAPGSNVVNCYKDCAGTAWTNGNTKAIYGEFFYETSDIVVPALAGISAAWNTWVPTFNGFSVDPTNVVARYIVIGNMCLVQVSMGTNGTSNSTAFTVSAPIPAKVVTSASWGGLLHYAHDNGAALTAPGRVFINSINTTYFTLQKTVDGGAWTDTGGKRAYFQLTYEIDPSYALGNRNSLNQTAVFSVEGALTVGAKTLRVYNTSGFTRLVTKVFLAANTAPVGAAVIVDVHKDGTTLFTNQANRPQIADGANTGQSTAIENNAWADGSYLTLEIDQIGAGTPGSDLTVHVVSV